MVWYDFVDFGLILFCIIIIAFRYRLLPNEIRLFLFYFILTLFIELAAEYFILQRKNNLFLYHFSSPLQYAILCLYFLNLFGQNANKKILFVLGMSVLVILLISFFLNPLNKYYSFASIMKNVIISVLVLIYFRKIFISNVNFENHVEENVWICTGLFINSLGNFFIEGSMNYLIESDRSVSIKLFYLHLTLDFLFYIIFICAVTFTRNRPVK